MSKLDDILISDKVGNPLYDQPFESEDPEYVELKQQIKDLIQELFDDVLLHGHPQSALEAYDALRQKVNTL